MYAYAYIYMAIEFMWLTRAFLYQAYPIIIVLSNKVPSHHNYNDKHKLSTNVSSGYE